MKSTNQILFQILILSDVFYEKAYVRFVLEVLGDTSVCTICSGSFEGHFSMYDLFRRCWGTLQYVRFVPAVLGGHFSMYDLFLRFCGALQYVRFVPAVLGGHFSMYDLFRRFWGTLQYVR